MDLNIWSAAMVFVLAFLGLLLVSLLTAFVWIAYRYDITFSIRTKESQEPESGDPQESTTWGIPENSKDLPCKVKRPS
jgi:hypothetical protein